MPLACNAGSYEVEEGNSGSFQASPCLKKLMKSLPKKKKKTFNISGDKLHLLP
jgi:hypothetical protein